MNKPLVTFTFITVTYNAGQTLERTLRSVAMQSYPHIEHILIDGASKDDTLTIAREKGKHLNEVVSEPDNGLYDAMNKGLQLATGDYVCFLNAGDILHDSNTLKRIYNTLLIYEGELPGVLYGDTDIVDGGGKFLYKRHLRPPSDLNWKSFSQGMLVCHQAFYARRDLCVRYNLHYKYSADFDWCIRVMKRADNFHQLEIGRASCRERVLRLV